MRLRNLIPDMVPSERSASRYQSRVTLPTSGEALRGSVLGERKRISRLSRIREVVLGLQDGLLVPLAVVTGLAGAAVTAGIGMGIIALIVIVRFFGKPKVSMQTT